jgi:hypothetical protein
MLSTKISKLASVSYVARSNYRQSVLRIVIRRPLRLIRRNYSTLNLQHHLHSPAGLREEVKTPSAEESDSEEEEEPS